MSSNKIMGILIVGTLSLLMALCLYMLLQNPIDTLDLDFIMDIKNGSHQDCHT